MKLYVWEPQEYGCCYYWVMAASEAIARKAVEESKHSPVGSWPAWPERWDFGVLDEGQVGDCEMS